MILAHEFFDALPVHKLKKTEKGWREILIDMKNSNEVQEDGEELRYIISREPTPASKLLIDVSIVCHFLKSFIVSDINLCHK